MTPLTGSNTSFFQFEVEDVSIKNYFSSFPQEDKLQTLFKNAFVLNKPMSGVGGDGYWIHHDKQYTYLVVFDCMGHGRLASMMTRVYVKIISEIVIDQHISDPDKILMGIHDRVEEMFRDKTGQSQSGSDMAVLRLEKSINKIIYAGARMDLILVDTSHIERIKSNKRQIGEHFDIAHSYETVEIDLIPEKNTKFYLFSDGITDLFGGPNNKRLGLPNLLDILTETRTESMDVQKVNIERKLNEWSGSNKPLDDQLLIGVAV